MCICLWDEFYLWTRALMSPNTQTLMFPHTYLFPDLNTHQHFRYQTSTQCHGNWRDNINLASVTCSVTYFPILTSRRYSECYLCALTSSLLSYEYTHIQTHTHAVSVAIKRALPVWVSHLVSVFSTDCDGSGVSLLVVLMWRDDTCGSWIERHKGFQIGNMEWWWWAGVLFLLFILPRGIFGTHQPYPENNKAVLIRSILWSSAGCQSAT